MPWRAGDMLVRKVGQIPPSRTPSGVATVALNPDASKLAIAGSSPAAAHFRIRGLLAASIPIRAKRGDGIVSDPLYEYSISTSSERAIGVRSPARQRNHSDLQLRSLRGRRHQERPRPILQRS